MPNSLDGPKPIKTNWKVSAKTWHDRFETWAELLPKKIKDEADHQLVRILNRMIEIKIDKR